MMCPSSILHTNYVQSNLYTCLHKKLQIFLLTYNKCTHIITLHKQEIIRHCMLVILQIYHSIAKKTLKRHHVLNLII